MKKKTKKMALGGKLMREMSPAASMAKSLRSGEAEGILRALPLNLQNEGATTDEPALNQLLNARSRAVSRMKRGGKVRGDGIAQRGKTKGRFV